MARPEKGGHAERGRWVRAPRDHRILRPDEPGAERDGVGTALV